MINGKRLATDSSTMMSHRSWLGVGVSTLATCWPGISGNSRTGRPSASTQGTALTAGERACLKVEVQRGEGKPTGAQFGGIRKRQAIPLTGSLSGTGLNAMSIKRLLSG